MTRCLAACRFLRGIQDWKNLRHRCCMKGTYCVADFSRWIALFFVLALMSCVSALGLGTWNRSYGVMRDMRAGIAAFQAEYGSLPKELIEICSVVPCTNTQKKRGFSDGWGKPLVYLVSDQSFELRSMGPDRKRGTEDDIVFIPEVERIRMRSVLGCYEVATDLETFPEELLVLDSTGGVFGYRASPAMRGFMGPHFVLVGADSIVITWMGAEQGASFRLRAAGDTLEGRYSSGGLLMWTKKGRVRAQRVWCP